MYKTYIKKVLISFLFAFILSLIFAEPKIINASSIALHGKPKYRDDFKYFDYVNSKAPKGGVLRQYVLGSYDNFNAFAKRGISAFGSDGIYDTLMQTSEDEIEVYYPLIAKSISYTEDFSLIIFNIDPNAKFQDGVKIRAHDIAFTFNKFLTEGVPQFKMAFEFVKKVKIISEQEIRFELSTKDKSNIIRLLSLSILPEHYWKNKNLGEPLTEVPIGSSSYKISDYKIGEYITYKKVPNYWAENIPSNIGKNNFESQRYDYYRDETIALEAFKAGEFDFQSENVAKNWATMYTGKNFDNGSIIKKEIEHSIPQGMQGFAFNIKRPIFSDRGVREALNYALDFEWMNKNYFYNQYQRADSYFINTEFRAKGLPSKEEVKILEKIKDKIPKEVFTKQYKPPITNASGKIRKEISIALAILKTSGWEIKNGKLTSNKTNEVMSFELLFYQPTYERIVTALKQNFKLMGIDMTARLVDSSQFINRLRNRDFDIISGSYSANPYPTKDLEIVWRSNYLDSTYNTAGVQDPAVDYLIDGIVANQDNYEMLIHWARALDRVLTWNFYVIPNWYLSKFRIAYWNKFSMPKIRPQYSLGMSTWWYDEKKANKMIKK